MAVLANLCKQKKKMCDVSITDKSHCNILIYRY